MPLDLQDLRRGWYCFKCQSTDFENGNYLREHLIRCQGTKHISFLTTNAARREDLELSYRDGIHDTGFGAVNPLLKRKRKAPDPSEDSDAQPNPAEDSDEEEGDIEVSGGGDAGSYNGGHEPQGDQPAQPEPWEIEQEQFDNYYDAGEEKIQQLQQQSSDDDSEDSGEVDSDGGEVESGYDPYLKPDAEATPPTLIEL